jgi:hypothetical protein
MTFPFPLLTSPQRQERRRDDTLVCEAEGTRILEAFLLTGADDAVVPLLLREANLAGYAFTILPEEHPSKSLFYGDYMLAAARQLNFKARLLPLAEAWRTAGIEVLIFKGFYLAEWVYALPGQRYFQDVDILLQPDQIPEAQKIAESLGWTPTWDYKSAMQPYSHVALHLLSADGLIQIDVHRQILHTRTPWMALQKRMTEQAWESAQSQKWGKVSIQVLQPVDSLVIGLILNRCWSLDLWQLKPHDLLDFRNLVQRYGLSRPDLLMRAQQLGCRRTVKLFLARCDPWLPLLNLRKPSIWERWSWELAIVPERGHLGFERTFGRFHRPGALQDFLRALPTVLHVLQVMNKASSLSEVLTQLLDQTCQPSWGFSLHRTIRGVRLATKILGLREPRAKQIAHLTIFSSLRHQGYAAYFCQLASNQPTQVPESWIELNGRTFDWAIADQQDKSSLYLKAHMRYPE